MEEKKETKNKVGKIAIVIGAIILVIILLDQVSKIVFLKQESKIEVIPNVLNLELQENKNGTYGVGANSTFSYVITNLVVIVILTKFMTSQNQFVDRKTKILLSLIIAGGISNVLDRIIRGYVVEFIHFNHLPIFNVADLFILIGWISMVAILAKFTVNEIRNRKKNEEKK